MDLKKLDKVKKEKKAKIKAFGKVIEDATFGNGEHCLGTSSGDLTGKPPEEISMGSPCDMLKWCYQNSGLRFMPYIELDFENSTQGVNVYEDGKLIDHIQVPATGGDNGDPATQITLDTVKIIGEIFKFVALGDKDEV